MEIRRGRRRATRREAVTRRPLVPVALVSLAALLALGAWALASPPGAAPDDNYHLSSIMCGHGDRSGLCSPGDQAGTRVVPVEAADAAACFRFVGTESAGCGDFSRVLTDNAVMTGGNWNGGYPPVFYFLFSFFVTSQIDSTVLLVRGLAIVVVVSVVTALHLALPARRRPLASVPLLACAVPLSAFLVASTNPSGWATVGVAVTWVALLAVFETTGRRRLALVGLAVAGTLMGAGSRSDTALFVAFTIGLVLVLRADALTSPRRHLPALSASAACVVLAAVLYVSSGSSVRGGFGANSSELGPAALAWANLLDLPTLWLGSFGSGPLNQLGWLDVGMPQLLGFACVAVLGSVLVLSTSRAGGRQAICVALVALALVVFPLYLLGVSGLRVGNGFQPRYALPLVVVLVGIVLLGRPTSTVRITRGQAVALALALSLANAAAMHVVMRRYLTGTDVTSLDLDAGAEWWWWDSGPLTPDVVWVVGSLAFAATALAVLNQVVAIPPTTDAAPTADTVVRSAVGPHDPHQPADPRRAAKGKRVHVRHRG